MPYRPLFPIHNVFFIGPAFLILCKGIEKLNSCRSNVDIPFSKVGVGQHKQIDDVGETQRDTRQKNGEETHALLDVMQNVNVDALHDLLFESSNVEEPVATSQVDGEACEHDVKDGETHQEQTDAVLVGLVERSLGFNHASETEVGGSLSSLLGVFVDATHALVANVQNEADDLGSLGQKSSSLNDVVMVELSCSWVFIELE